MSLSDDEDDQMPLDWHRYRVWLRMLVSGEVGQQLQTKLDPSDLVQQTLLEAYRGLATFRGRTEEELMGWMKQILGRTVAKAVRDYSRQRRDIHRERAIEAAIHSSSLRLERLLPDAKAAPELKTIQAEDVLRLTAALEQLPAAQRQAIELHHLDAMTIADVAMAMDRTPSSVAGLLKRGIKSLRHCMVPRI